MSRENFDKDDPISDHYSRRLNAAIANQLFTDFPDYFEKYYQYFVPFTKRSQILIFDTRGTVFTEEEELEYEQFKRTVNDIKNSFR